MRYQYPRPAGPGPAHHHYRCHRPKAGYSDHRQVQVCKIACFNLYSWQEFSYLSLITQIQICRTGQSVAILDQVYLPLTPTGEPLPAAHIALFAKSLYVSRGMLFRDINHRRPGYHPSVSTSTATRILRTVFQDEVMGISTTACLTNTGIHGLVICLLVAVVIRLLQETLNAARQNACMIDWQEFPLQRPYLMNGG